jgi:hypothetical protein
MVHWRLKLPTIVLVALAIASAVGKIGPYGFHW